MVVAAHRVAMGTLVLGSYALSPTILPGTNPQPHRLLLSLIELNNLKQKTFEEHNIHLRKKF